MSVLLFARLIRPELFSGGHRPARIYVRFGPRSPAAGEVPVVSDSNRLTVDSRAETADYERLRHGAGFGSYGRNQKHRAFPFAGRLGQIRRLGAQTKVIGKNH